MRGCLSSALGLVVVVAIIGAIAGGRGSNPTNSTTATSTPASTETSTPPPTEHVAPAPNAPTYCDRNVHVGHATTCPFAENVFRAYAVATHASGSIGARVTAKSPATGLVYSMICHGHGGTSSTVACTGGKGAVVEFPYLAAHEYSTASTPAPATGSSEPEENRSSTEPESGSGGGIDEVGSYSHEGDEQFCQEHECIGNFTQEPGRVVECSDGSFSHSGGISGACSDHGGEAEG